MASLAGLGASAAGLALMGGCDLPSNPLQQTRTTARIGYLTSNTVSGGAPQVEAFRHGLQDVGYVEGQNLLVEYRYGEGNLDRLAELAAELVKLPVSVIVAGSTDPARAAMEASGTIPVVIVNTSDAVAEGLIPELTRPGGQVTGLSAFPEVNAKRLELLKNMNPGLSRVAVLWGSAVQYRVAEQAAAALGLQALSLEIPDPETFSAAFETALQWHAEAFMTTGGPSFSSSTAQIVEFATTHRLPAMYYRREFASAGGLMAYGPNLPAMFRRSAFYVDRILKGAKPGDLPVERPTTFDFAVNGAAAQALGLAVPPDVAAQVTEWV
jgi:putative ABC transport system substrate-binding protein